MKPSHRCGVCEGKRVQATKYLIQCPVRRIMDAAEKRAVASLKRHGHWRGRAWFESLVELYYTVSERLALEGGRVSGRWPVATALLAEAILGARAAVDAEEQKV